MKNIILKIIALKLKIKRDKYKKKILDLYLI